MKTKHFVVLALILAGTNIFSLALVILPLLGGHLAPIQIRVQNLLGYDLDEAAVGTNSFGPVRNAMVSAYKTVPMVFEDVSIFTYEKQRGCNNYRIIGGAIKPGVPAGNYTYILQGDPNHRLKISLHRDL